jgi:hypothetical protein
VRPIAAEIGRRAAVCILVGWLAASSADVTHCYWVRR